MALGAVERMRFRVSKEAADGLTRYCYDTCNRLVEVQYPDIMGRQHFERLTYDGAGNRITRLTESVTEQYRYDNCNRLEELRKTDNRTGQEEERNTYRYDRQGNLLSDGSLSYVYDGFSRVAEVETAEGSTQKNRYDAEGLRHEMEENGQLVQFLYADREVIAETQSDGNVIRYIRGLGLISSDSENAKTYYHYVSDEQGSITHVTEGEGKDADEQHDPVTRQYYLRARYYNPVIGRFTQEDTYYGDGLNLYQYCAGNPVRYCDPSGHGSVEQNPYKRYTDVGANADTAALAGQAYPDASSKQSLYNKYRNMGYSAENALMLANHEIIHGTASTEAYANNVPKTGTDRTQTSPRDNYSTDWRSQNRANQQRQSNTGDGFGRGNYTFDSIGNEIPCVSDFYDISNIGQIEDARFFNQPMFYGVTLENGNNIYVSTGNIRRSQFADIANQAEGRVAIISGMHGDGDGNLLNVHNGITGQQLLQEDINAWGNSNNITIYDVSQLDANQVRQIIQTNNHTIFGWCLSERSRLVLEALGLN